ncbi:unnamed protein product, partial [marine sediment metagenome]
YIQDVYNFTFEFFSDIKTFDVNYTDPVQWYATNVEVYNYTLYQASTIFIELKIDTSNYMTNFSYYQGDFDAIWGENISYQINSLKYRFQLFLNLLGLNSSFLHLLI